MTGDSIYMPTRALDPVLVERLKALKTGDRIRITHALRVGNKSWNATTTGTFRGLNYLATGITTDRVAEDDIVVPTLHFTKENGELTSIALDENTKVELP